MANGSGSRSRSRVLIKSNNPTTKADEDNTGYSTAEKEPEVLAITFPAESSEIPQEESSKKKISRLNILIT